MLSSLDYSPAVQDYLRALYLLASRHPTGGRVTTSRLAAQLTVRPASVTAMLQKMAALEPGLVDYHKSRGAQLTPAGERAALGVVRCHRLIEMFLHEKLGYGWDEVHEEADRLEHVISDELAERLSAALGHPRRDPHGHAIPAADLSLEHAAALPLRELAAGQRATVQQVQDDDPALLRRFEALGLRPGALITLVDAPPGGPLRLRVSGRAVVLDATAAEHIFVDL
jgi:DtxR family Mn-dependent transcriptional regulator